MHVLNRDVETRSKYITDLSADLKNIDHELSINPVCKILLQKRVTILQDMYDKTRIELVLAAANVRQIRGTCEDCMRCTYSEGI